MAETRRLPASPIPELAPLHLRELTEATGLVAAVRLALDSGLVSAISQRVHIEDLPEHTGLRPSTCEILLRQLRRTGVLTADGPPRLLVDEDGVRWTVRRWEHLAEVGVGRPAPPTAHLYPQVTPLLGQRLRAGHLRAASLLGRDGLHMLDLGAGVSPVGQEIARRWHGVRVTAVDHPDVLATLQAELDRAAPQTREAFRLLAGDITRDPLPTGADLTMLSAVLHLFSESDILSLLRRAVRATRRGGQVAVVDVLLPEAAHEEDPRVLAYELELHLRHPQGGIWRYSTMAAWCARAGLRRLTRTELPDRLMLITGTVEAT